MPPPRRVFYGWYVVGAVFVITTTTSGLTFYNLSILLAAFVAERGFPVALASSATATFFIAGGIGGVIAGRLVDRIDARIVIAGGAVLGALALASVGLLREAWQLYAFHVVFGLSHGASGLVPVTTVIARWFSVRRSLAFSIGSTGLSLGGIVVAPLVALAIDAPRPGRRRALDGARAAARHRAGDAAGAAAEPAGDGPRAGRPEPRGESRLPRRSPPPPTATHAAAATSTPSPPPTCSCSAPRSAPSRISTASPAPATAPRPRPSRSPCSPPPARSAA